MLAPSLLALLLPVLVAAIPAIPAIPAPTPAGTKQPTAVSASFAIELENLFREIRNANKRNSTAAAGSGGGDVQALGDLVKGPGDPNVTITRNELLEGRCDPIIVIFARGTTAPGNVGDDVGPMFFDELLKLRRATIQGVNHYPADIWGYLAGGSDSGAKDMADSVRLVAVQCPGSRIVLSGFSQGAQVTHKAAQMIPELHAKVGAIVLFGDPNNGDPFPGSLNNNVKTFCEPDDLICRGLPFPDDAHSHYEDRAPEAAAYVAARIPG